MDKGYLPGASLGPRKTGARKKAIVRKVAKKKMKKAPRRRKKEFVDADGVSEPEALTMLVSRMRTLREKLVGGIEKAVEQLSALDENIEQFFEDMVDELEGRRENVESKLEDAESDTDEANRTHAEALRGLQNRIEELVPSKQRKRSRRSRGDQVPGG